MTKKKHANEQLVADGRKAYRIFWCAKNKKGDFKEMYKRHVVNFEFTAIR